MRSMSQSDLRPFNIDYAAREHYISYYLVMQNY